jgi:hypothetical protein
MMNLLKSTLMAGGVMLAIASAAQAADLPTTKCPPARAREDQLLRDLLGLARFDAG